MTIATLNRENLRTLRIDLDAALKTVADKHGLAIKAGSISFSDTNATVKVEVATIAEGGAVITKEAVEFKRSAFLYGLKPEWLGEKFTDFSGATFEIVGIKGKSPKYPVLCKNVRTGKVYKYPEAQVKMLMERAGHAAPARHTGATMGLASLEEGVMAAMAKHPGMSLAEAREAAQEAFNILASEEEDRINRAEARYS